MSWDGILDTISVADSTEYTLNKVHQMFLVENLNNLGLLKLLSSEHYTSFVLVFMISQAHLAELSSGKKDERTSTITSPKPPLTQHIKLSLNCYFIHIFFSTFT